MSESSETEDHSTERVLSPGDLVRDRWRVVAKLGEGGFGTVYKVTSEITQREYAMKLESIKEKVSMLKLEVTILKTLRKDETLKLHACQYFDSGKTDTFRFMVMELVGTNLSDLRRSRPHSHFSESTTVRLGLQCLESIIALHRIGYLHRDIKPANYAMGRGGGHQNASLLYMLDYGLARRYLNVRDDKMNAERKVAGFRGTVRYASVHAHSKKDLGRRDDLWSWLYVIIEFRRGELPWRKIRDKHEVGRRKRETNVDQLLHGMPPELFSIHYRLQQLEFSDRPDYDWFHQKLENVLVRKECHAYGPFDWEIDQQQQRQHEEEEIVEEQCEDECE